MTKFVSRHESLSETFRFLAKRRTREVFNYNIKLSYHMTGLDRPLGFQKAEILRISRHSAHEGGRFDIGQLYPPGKHRWCSLLLEAEAIPD